MSRDYAELERELIEDLKQRTGKNLAEWMEAIDAANLPDRNAIIDWLRPQGFSFSNASWIERIHHNGGRPIYLDRAPARRSGRPRSQDAPAPKPAPPGRSIESCLNTPSIAAPRAAPASAGRDSVAGLIAAGKAYRPLAEMVLAEAARALPGLAFEARSGLVFFLRPNLLAVLSIAPKQLRLGMDLGDRPFGGPLARAKLADAPASITHMLVLTDARQVDGALVGYLLEADARANPAPPAADRHH
ncbi:MAG TPA: DUF5655 domain-containing protein [Hyphomicrobiaceae bacterium]|nr:DUF5655 domain-containing protein [Hyphomicrobiaceae bacterium]